MTKGDKFYFIMVVLAVILIAGSAAGFSVYGVSKVYAGYAKWIIVMAAGIEYGKLVAVSLLHRYWSSFPKLLRAYFLLAVAGVMIVTSLGIYGFLTAAYQKTAAEVTRADQNIALIETKQGTFQVQIDQLEKRTESKAERIEMLSDLRVPQEKRLDSLYVWGRNKSAKAIEDNIKQTNVEITSLSEEIDGFNEKIGSLQDSISTYELKKIDLKSKQGTGELGPLQYLSRLIDRPMDKIINWFNLLIIFIFDPLSVGLVLALNHIVSLSKDKGGTKEPTPKRNELLSRIGTYVRRRKGSPSPNPDPDTIPESSTPDPVVIREEVAPDAIEPNPEVLISEVTNLESVHDVPANDETPSQIPPPEISESPSELLDEKTPVLSEFIEETKESVPINLPDSGVPLSDSSSSPDERQKVYKEWCAGGTVADYRFRQKTHPKKRF